MSKGKLKTVYLGREGQVAHSDVPSWDFIYSASTVKDPDWEIGDVVELPGRREFVYAKSDGVCNAGRGCEFTAVGVQTGGLLSAAQAVGDKQISVAAGTHDTLTVDCLRGGYVIIYTTPANASETCQFRGIIGNTAALTAVGFTLYLDGPLNLALTTSSTCEVFQNPYAAVHTGTVANFPKAGLPAVYVSATLMYFWVQTKGPCWVFPATGQVGAAGGLGCMWSNNGGYLEAVTDALVGTSIKAGMSTQYAGYVLEGSQPNNGPLFNLQG